MHPIERQSARGIVQYTIASGTYYESLDHYTPRDSYEAVLRRDLPASWSTLREGIFVHAIPPGDDATPDHGFKIHLTSTPELAADCLATAAAACAPDRVAFKAILDPFLLGWLNSTFAPLSQSGKFITIYPRDATQFRALADALVNRTRQITGPYILSDAPHPDSRAVFYRYGGFTKQMICNVYGEAVPVYRHERRLRPDERTTSFELPGGVEDPYAVERPPAPTGAPTGAVMLRGRYQVRDVLHRTNKGGVYGALDTTTGGDIVIKEGRPFVRNGDGHDATDLVRHEAEILDRLAGTGVTPRVVELFPEWENWFLAMERVPGEPLARYRAREELAYRADGLATLLTVIKHICAALQAIHARGVIVGDLAPQNILVDPVTLAVHFIDFETACTTDAPRTGGTGTPGFMSDARRAGQPLTVRDDLFALGRVIFSIFYPVVGAFDLMPDAERPLLGLWSTARRTPWLERLVFDVPADLAGAGATIDAIIAGLATDATDVVVTSSPAIASPRFEHTFGDVVSRMRCAVLGAATLDRRDRLFPADWRIFQTNPLSLAYGAAGVCLFLDATGGVPAPVLNRFDAMIAAADLTSYPAGAYVGLAGLAWTLGRLGRLDAAAAIMRTAFDAPSRYDAGDFHYGCAGWATVSLQLHRWTRDPVFLDHARQAAAHLDRTATPHVRSEDGTVYHGLAHGNAGAALFVLRLWQQTGDPDHHALAIRLLDTELAAARRGDDGLTWTSIHEGGLRISTWRYGNAGMIPVLLRFHAALGDPRYLETARAAANPLHGVLAVVPGLFGGMTGIGEALAAMHAATGEPGYRDEARRIAERILAFAMPAAGPPDPDGKPAAGLAFPGDELVRICHDYGTGTAGIGLLFCRLLGATLPSLFDVE